MNIMMNSLPTRTWNKLGMNESRVSVEADFINMKPEITFDPAEVNWTQSADWAVGASANGFSRDVNVLTAAMETNLLETEEDAAMTHPAILTYRYDTAEAAASKLVLHAKKNSTLQAVLLLTSKETCRQALLQTEIFAEEDAVVNLYVAQLMDAEAQMMHEISGLCEENAKIKLTRLELGGAKAYSGANIDLLGTKSDFTTEIGYHGRTGQLLDMNYVALHHGRNTNSLMEINGTLEEGSRKIFRGTIDFQQGCAGAKGTENENVLVLGEDMVNQTIPLILCKEEDVEGNHGASIGRLDEKILFYLGSRGISQEEAQQIIARSRIEAICNQFPDEVIREQIHAFENRKGLSEDGEL